MSLFEVKVPVAVAATEAIENALAEAENAGWGVFEDRPTASAWLAGYFPSRTDGVAALKRLRTVLRGVAKLGAATQRVMPDADWREAYKAHFKPWHSGRLHWVPLWERERYALPAGDVAVWLDPGMAFGTGNHETTRLCCERLVAFAAQPGNTKLEIRNSKLGTRNPEPNLSSCSSSGARSSKLDASAQSETRPARQNLGGGGNPKPDLSSVALAKEETRNPSRRVIDAGCGSGILAISAAKLDCLGPVIAFDNDPDAVRISAENAALNGLQGRVEFFVGDLVTGLRGRQADLVMANILANVLRRFARELVGAVAPGGWLVLSGILATEIEDVRRDFATVARGWPIESRTLGEWSDLKLVRPE